MWQAERGRGATGGARGDGTRRDGAGDGAGRARLWAHIGISSDESADSSSSLSRTSTCAWCLAPSSVCRRSSAISVICCRLRSATSASPVRLRDMREESLRQNMRHESASCEFALERAEIQTQIFYY